MVGMRDVAKKAGVSLSSVSLVINGTGYVSQDMRDKVEQAMRELNYVPNELARNFYHGKTGIVGVIVPTIQHPFFATLTAHLQREFAARSLRTMLCSTVDSASGEAQYVEMLRQRSLDALNVAIVGGPRAQFTDLSGSNTTFPTVRYVQTLEKCLSQTGIAHTYVESGEVCDLDGVRRAVHGVFNAHPGIDAFVGADLAAAFAMQEATMRGIAVPGQLQIVAYDGTMAADCAGLPLTVVRQDFDAIAHALAGRIETEITRFAGDAQSPMMQTPEPEIVPVTLEARTTTR